MGLSHEVKADPECDGSIRILLIEDHIDTAAAVRRLLQKEGYEVTIASTAQEAMAAAAQNRFDVVVSDMHLPDGKGGDVVTALRAHFGPVPAIAVTGESSSDVAADARRMGFTDFLIKPVFPDKLFAAIAACIQR